ncbi:DUF1481 domain-containing protein [Edaphovirga cremea]|uniref:DUF1481 domain-containing protein n=1 Tax=Edaphovirga cremea TaxID=2267246 RepID=UPI003988C5B3
MTPLLFMRPSLIAGLLAFGLVGCSTSTPPLFTASGYVADQGINRLWRMDDTQQQPQTLINVYSPYHGGDTIITRYEYQNRDLRLVRETHAGEDGEIIQLRFDGEGEVSFMQRQLATRREKLSSDDIIRYKYQAQRVLELSNTLRAGRVELQQGLWKQGVITGCNGKQLQPEFGTYSQVWLAKRASQSDDLLGLAWLNAPEGTELLLVANEDFCRWEPKANDM